MSIGARLRQLRLANGLTQDQIGEICGVTKGMVSQWESDTVTPPTERLVALRGRLTFSLDWLMADAGPPPGTEEEERKLAELYRHTDNRGRRSIFRVAEQESSYSKESVAPRVATQ